MALDGDGAPAAHAVAQHPMRTRLAAFEAALGAGALGQAWRRLHEALVAYLHVARGGSGAKIPCRGFAYAPVRPLRSAGGRDLADAERWANLVLLRHRRLQQYELLRTRGGRFLVGACQPVSTKQQEVEAAWREFFEACRDDAPVPAATLDFAAQAS